MDWDTETEDCCGDLALQPSGGADENGGSGGAVVGGGGMSSGPGTDRLRANFMAGGCRKCFSSSGTPVVTDERRFAAVRGENEDYSGNNECLLRKNDPDKGTLYLRVSV